MVSWIPEISGSIPDGSVVQMTPAFRRFAKAPRLKKAGKVLQLVREFVVRGQDDDGGEDDDDEEEEDAWWLMA